jgi:hypothetical protein
MPNDGQHEYDFQTNNQSDDFWKAYSRQMIDFENALAELVDNALSARRLTPGGTVPAYIEITVEEKENTDIRLQVGDNGTGVAFENLASDENIFNMGYQPPESGEMNEHGFGLKNALAMLTSGFSTDFTFLTRPIEEEEGNIYRVDGPIQTNMTARITDQDEWARDLDELAEVDSGVKVVAHVQRDYFSTIYTRGSRFETLIERLGEHLGVMYNHYLSEDEEGGNTIMLRYKSKGADEWRAREIPPIPVPFLVNQEVGKNENTITVEVDGEEHEATYIHGTLDTSVKNNDADDEHDWPYPLRIHFQGSNARCGVTMTVRNRVLRTGVFGDIWPDKAGDVSYNNFLAELILDEDFSTTNNKTGLDPHSDVWVALRERLREDFEPSKDTRKQAEDALREKVIDAMSAAHQLEGADEPSHKNVWDRGAEIDVYYEANGNKYIIETKVQPAKILDLYQLLMYWDGVVDDTGESPERATLVAEEFSNYLHDAKNHLESLTDENGNNYNLEFQGHDRYED